MLVHTRGLQDLDFRFLDLTFFLHGGESPTQTQYQFTYDMNWENPQKYARNGLFSMNYPNLSIQ